MDRSMPTRAATARRRAATVIAVVASIAVGASAGRADAVGALGIGTDFNGDGYADLALGIPSENLGSGQSGGAVQVLYGSPTGLTVVAGQLWSQNSAGIADSAEDHDSFGSALTTGDFDGDGFTDLAIGAPREDYVAGNTDDGVVHVLYGSTAGLTWTGSQLWSQDVAGIPGLGESWDDFGGSLAAGDVDGDGDDDLVIGATGEDNSAGSVTVIKGTSIGLRPDGSQLWNLNSPGVPGEPETNSSFGAEIVIGDFTGDGAGDLAIAWSPSKTERNGVHHDFGGRVLVLRGSPGGLTAQGAQVWSQDSPGIAGVAAEGDGFGAAMAAADLDRSGHDELIVGARYDEFDESSSGSVHVIPGSGTGLTASGSTLWSAEMPGIAGPGDTFGFGCTLAIGNFGGTKDIDVAIGACEAPVTGVGDSGGIYVLLGTGSGLTTAGDQFWSVHSPGIAAQIATAGVQSGGPGSIVGGNFDGTGLTDLAIAAPKDDLIPGDQWQEQGVAHVIYGGSTALDDSTAELWMQGRLGLPGAPEQDDSFSWAMA